MKIFLLLLITAVPHWIKGNDSYFITQVYVDAPYGNVIGWYYEPAKGDRFMADCFWRHGLKEFATEQAAREFVMGCPQ